MLPQNMVGAKQQIPTERKIIHTKPYQLPVKNYAHTHTHTLSCAAVKDNVSEIQMIKRGWQRATSEYVCVCERERLNKK